MLCGRGAAVSSSPISAAHGILINSKTYLAIVGSLQGRLNPLMENECTPQDQIYRKKEVECALRQPTAKVILQNVTHAIRFTPKESCTKKSADKVHKESSTYTTVQQRHMHQHPAGPVQKPKPRLITQEFKAMRSQMRGKLWPRVMEDWSPKTAIVVANDSRRTPLAPDGISDSITCSHNETHAVRGGGSTRRMPLKADSCRPGKCSAPARRAGHTCSRRESPTAAAYTLRAASEVRDLLRS